MLDQAMRLFSLAVLVAAPAQAPPFEHWVARLAPAQLPHSWRAGCPVAPAQLRRIRLTYWGFDGKAHSGALDVHADSVQEIAPRSFASCTSRASRFGA